MVFVVESSKIKPAQVRAMQASVTSPFWPVRSAIHAKPTRDTNPNANGIIEYSCVVSGSDTIWSAKYAAVRVKLIRTEAELIDESRHEHAECTNSRPCNSDHHCTEPHFRVFDRNEELMRLESCMRSVLTCELLAQ